MQPNQNDPVDTEIPENRLANDDGLVYKPSLTGLGNVSAPGSPEVNIDQAQILRQQSLDNQNNGLTNNAQANIINSTNQSQPVPQFQDQTYPQNYPLETQPVVQTPFDSTAAMPASAAMPNITSIPMEQPIALTVQPAQSINSTTNTVGNQDSSAAGGSANSPQLNTVYIGSNDSIMSSAPSGHGAVNGKSAKIKKIFAYVLGFGLVATAICVFLFVFYIPNLPQNVWKRGFNRTGDEMAKLVESMAKPESLKSIDKTKVAMTGDVTIGGKTSTMSLDLKQDAISSDNSLQVNAVTPDDQKFNIVADLKTTLPKDALLPNMYFRIGGFGELGLDALLPGINQYENKWIAVEQDFIKPYESTITQQSKTTNTNVTDEDVISVMNDINTVLQEYVYSSDPEKAIIQLKEFIKTEKSEGIKANHYKAKINKDNFVKGCSALVDKLAVNKVIKENTKPTADQIKSTKKLCESSAQTISDDFEFDLWVDKKYSLIHKVRFYTDLKKQEKELLKQKVSCLESMDSSVNGASFCDYYDEKIRKGQEYVEFGQIYLGKDSFKLFAGGVSDTDKDKSNGRINIMLNLKTFEVSGDANLTNKTKESDYSANLKYKAVPYDGTIDSSKPSGAIPIQKLFEKFMGGMPVVPVNAMLD